MQLAKNVIDVGLSTNNLQPMLRAREPGALPHGHRDDAFDMIRRSTAIAPRDRAESDEVRPANVE
jgi:hypothetical protein